MEWARAHEPFSDQWLELRLYFKYQCQSRCHLDPYFHQTLLIRLE